VVLQFCLEDSHPHAVLRFAGRQKRHALSGLQKIIFQRLSYSDLWQARNTGRLNEI